LNFIIDTSPKAGNNYLNTDGVMHVVTFNNNTGMFQYIYSDSNNQVTEGRLSITEDDVLINTSTSSGSAGTITIYIPQKRGSSYTANAYITYNALETFMESLTYTYQAEDKMSGNQPLWWLFILTIAFAFLGMMTKIKELALIMTPLPTILFTTMGFIAFPLWAAFGLEILAIITAFMIQD
jgi:hypothetical protein